MDSTLPLRDVAQFTHYSSGNDFTTGSSANGSWTYEERYRYDHQLDYLTEASYDGGSSYRTWSYDPAGNRASDSGVSGSWTYDNLNRMTASPGHTYVNDILGNRTWRDYSTQTAGANRYLWNSVNRLDRFANESTGAVYKYRADGMRVQKNEGLTLEWIYNEDEGSGFYDDNFDTNLPTWRYMHDGQMTIEEDNTRVVDENIVSDIYKYGIGARGIDWIEKDTYNASPVVAFPIYDGHGNMVATAGRVGSGFQNADPRAYDAWGGVRGGNTTGDPKQRYCANLGHVQDDESGLTYMRARYYEPWTGRFVNEDPARAGRNWYVYVSNDPIAKVDPEGEFEGLSDHALNWLFERFDQKYPNLLGPWAKAMIKASAAIVYGALAARFWTLVSISMFTMLSTGTIGGRSASGFVLAKVAHMFAASMFVAIYSLILAIDNIDEFGELIALNEAGRSEYREDSP